jgi:hypothetical protein
MVVFQVIKGMKGNTLKNKTENNLVENNAETDEYSEKNRRKSNNLVSLIIYIIFTCHILRC